MNKLLLTILLLPSLLFPETSSELTLSEIKKIISKSEKGKAWTHTQNYSKGYRSTLVTSFPSGYSLTPKEFDPPVLEKVVMKLSNGDNKRLASTMTDYTKRYFDIKMCGDTETRSFSVEYEMENGDFINVEYVISYSALFAGTIFIHTKTGELKQTLNFNTKESKQENILHLFSNFIDPDCSGYDCLNGYCFSFQKAALVLREEHWKKLAQDRKREHDKKRVADLQDIFKNTLLPQLNHLNSFDSDVLSEYQDVDSTDSTNHLQHMIINLRKNAISQNCKLLWSNSKKMFYFEVPDEISRIYTFDNNPSVGDKELP